MGIALIVPHIMSENRATFIKNHIKVIKPDLVISLSEFSIDPEVLVENKVEFLNYEIFSRSIVKKIISFLYNLRKLKKLRKKYNIRLAISLGDPANLFNVLSYTLNNKIVLTFHSHYSTDFALSDYFNQRLVDKIKKHVRILVIKMLYNKADLLVAVSESCKKDLIDNFGLKEDKIKVIYNPFFLEVIKSRAKEDIGHFSCIFQNPTIITAGRLSKQKGHWYLLRIFKELKKKHPELRLVILGDGELKEYLVSLSKALDLQTFVWDKNQCTDEYDVYFLGHQENPYKFFSRAKMFVLTSLWEGLPSVLIEALACGLPVISTDCPSGPREILAPNTDIASKALKPEFSEYGILMPNFDGKYMEKDEPLTQTEKIWIDTMENIISKEEILSIYSRLGPRRAQEFDAAKVALKWGEILTNLLSNE